jgi:hypothetical protein
MSLCTRSTSSTIHTNSLARTSKVTDRLDQVRRGIRGGAAKSQSLEEGRSYGKWDVWRVVRTSQQRDDEIK